MVLLAVAASRWTENLYLPVERMGLCECGFPSLGHASTFSRSTRP